MISKAEIKKAYTTAQDYSEIIDAIGMCWDRCNGLTVGTFKAEVVRILGVMEWKRVAKYAAEEIVTNAMISFGIVKGHPGIVDTDDKYITKNYAEIKR